MRVRTIHAGCAALAITGSLFVSGPAAVAASGLSPAAVVSKARHTVYLVDCEGDRPRVKPEFIALACADYGIVVKKASWAHWGDRTATASGRLAENDCIPNCAAGSFHSEPAKITVTSIKDYHGRYEYGHIRVVPKAPNSLHFAIWSGPLSD